MLSGLQDLNLGVIGIEMGLKFTRQEENTRTLGIWNRNRAGCILMILIR